MFTTPLPRFTDTDRVATFGDTLVEVTDFHAFVTSRLPEAVSDLDAADADWSRALDFAESHGITTVAPDSEHHVEGVVVWVYPR